MNVPVKTPMRLATLPAVRLIATDLDGTLLRSDGTISLCTRQTLDRIRATGVYVVLVTARPPRMVQRIARESGMTGIAICCNGASIYDCERDVLIRHLALSHGLASQLILGLRAAVPGIHFAAEHAMYFVCEPAITTLDVFPPWEAAYLGDLLSFYAKKCDEPLSKLIAWHPQTSPETLLAVAQQIAREDVMLTHSGAPFIEMSAKGVDKAQALAGLCASLGIDPAEVIAFGDMPNDIPMLQWAGTGIAVANAHTQVIAYADYVTFSNEEDGVARTLEQFLESRLQG